MNKRFFSFLLILCVLFSMAVIPAHAASSGTCGDNLTWTLDDEGTLTISGTGGMTDYSSLSAPWYSSNSSIKKVIIENGITSIGEAAFCDCSNLTSITIPDSVTCIGHLAFGYCSSLKSITIPDSVTSIGYAAFSCCSSLTTITIPDSVTSIGDCAFSSTAWYNNQPDGLVYAGKVVYRYKGTMPSNTSIVLESDTKGIAAFAFMGYNNLISIGIPNGVISIGDSALASCSSLTSIIIPDSVTSIGGSAFSSCSSLTAINVSENNHNYSSQDGVLFNKDKTTLICCPGGKKGSYTIPDSVTSIGNNAFHYCHSLTTITIPDSVTSIGDCAFYYCSSLTTITIPDSVTSIGSWAFCDCSSLEKVYYPGTASQWNKISIGSNNDELKNAELSIMTQSGTCGKNLTWTLYDNGTLIISGTGDMDVYYSFSYVPWYSFCASIKTVVIGNGVTNIGNYAFYNCSSLTSVNIPNSVTSIGSYAFQRCSNLTSITIPESVTSIEQGAFYYCSALTSVTIPDRVTIIRNYVFQGCSNLTSIIIPNGVTSIGDCAFYYCSNLTSLTIPDSVTSVGEWAFRDCYKLASIKIGSNVTSIGSRAFERCTFASLTIPDRVTNIGSYAFEGCNITSIRIPDRVTNIENGVFYNCRSLTDVTIPNSVTSIGKEAFYHCSFASVAIPNSVTSIGECAFQECFNLTSITIPDSVISIGECAFYPCSSLKKVYYSGTSSQWDSISIGSGNDYLENAERHCFYNITYTGEYEGTDTAYYLTSVTFPTLPEPPFGYTYTFKVNDEVWDGVVKGDTTVVVAKAPINYTVTYTGEYEGTDKADYLTTVTFPASPYGYTYIFKVNDEAWDGVVKGDTTVVVTKTPINYTVTYTGEYEGTDNADYLTTVTFPTAPYGYTYTSKVDGKVWDGVVKGNTTVVVTKTPINYTVTYAGEYTGTDNADYLTKVTFPTAPYGYTYTFKVDGKVWDGVVKGDTTVVVTKTINNYAVTYTGDYTGTDNADYLTSVTLPTPPENYVYRFTVHGSAWDGIVKGDTTVVVSKLCDLAELDITNLENVQKDGNSICGKFYGKYFTPQATVSENATYAVYSDDACTDELTSVVLAKGENTFYIKVTTESGRQSVYTITANRDIPQNLGTLSVENVEGDAITFKADTEIVGNPTIKIFYGENQDALNNQKTAEIGEDRQSISISGVPTDKVYYFKAVATYDDIQIESPVIFTTLAKCYVLQVLSPSGSTIDYENGTITGLRVASDVEKLVIDVEVSPKATWDLYYTATSNTTYANKELTLRAGQTKTAYIRVKAEDGTEKAYKISVYRQTKSEKPSISVSLGTAKITSVDNKNIIYTIVGTEPSESNGIRYSGPFEVSDGMVIKAIAKQDGVDEYIDVTLYEVKDANVSLTPIDVYYDGEKINYEFFAESSKPIYGIFMLAVYDAKGKMTTLFEADKISGETEKLINGSLSVADKDYSTCKVMLWNNYNEMKPLTKAVLVEKD